MTEEELLPKLEKIYQDNRIHLMDELMVKHCITNFDNLRFSTQTLVLQLITKRLKQQYRTDKKITKIKNYKPRVINPLLPSSIIAQSEYNEKVEMTFWMQDDELSNMILNFFEKYLMKTDEEEHLSFYFIFVRGTLPIIYSDGIGPIADRIRNLENNLTQNPVYHKMIEKYESEYDRKLMEKD